MNEDKKDSEFAKEIFDEMLDKVLEISRVSYDQENERKRNFLNKSDNLIKYISTIMIFVNILLPILFANKIINLAVLIVLYWFISLPLIITIYYAIKVQVLRLGTFFPTGKIVLEEMKKEPNLLKINIRLKNKFIMYYSESTEKLQSSNDKRAISLRNAFISYSTSIVFLAIAITLIMIIIA